MSRNAAGCSGWLPRCFKLASNGMKCFTRLINKTKLSDSLSLTTSCFPENLATHFVTPTKHYPSAVIMMV